MNTPSTEQQLIIDSIKNGNNVIVDACAGSGKSTTILSLASQLPEINFIQLTYNSSLRYEIRDKVKQLNITNLQVHTYHSLAVRYYDSNAYTDTGMRRIVYQDLSLDSIPALFEVVVIDEAQDMTILYYNFVKKFILNNKRKVQLMILGDYKQGLYTFKGADTRFLTLGEEIWKDFELLKNTQFEKKTLQMSYRITDQICAFVNDVMLNEQRMLSCRSGPNVVYIRRQSYQIEKIIINRILSLISDGAKPDEIFILSGSIKGQRAKKIENALVINNIPCYVPLFETDKMDERVIIGKVGLSTFHSVKGRQRKYVFVLGFDNNYFTFYGRDMETTVCPNTLYVAATRSSSQLFLCEVDDYHTDRPCDFLNKTHNEMNSSEYIDFLGIPRSIFYEKDKVESNNPGDSAVIYNITPTELLKFIHEDVLEKISPLLDSIMIKTNEKEEVIDIPSIIKTKLGLYEEVSDLNGIAIPCMYYDDLNLRANLGEDPVLHSMIQERVDQMDKPNPYLWDSIQDVNEKMVDVEDYLYAANVYKAIDENLYSKLKQISKDDCNWLHEEDIIKCKERLDKFMGADCDDNDPQVEYSIIHQTQEQDHVTIDTILEPHLPENVKFRFSARVDLITDKSVAELKCTNELSLDHMIQIVIYAWLWNCTHDEERDFKLYNIKTAELYVLNNDMSILNEIMILLIQSKYTKNVQLDDPEFIKKCTD
jgi:hypothetical protein